METNKLYDYELGVILSNGSTQFRVWSPEAKSVAVKIYSSYDTVGPEMTLDMAIDENGVWSYDYPGSLEGKYYTYSYTYGAVTREAIDIYAKAVGINGERGYIADFSKTSPEGWENEGYVSLSSYCDAIIYETHVRDFSSDQSSGVSKQNQKKFLAFTEEDTKTPSGEPTCLSHISDLGITHVHLLPVADYFGVDEKNPDDSYNWGYNPLNYNAPEGSYSSNPYDPTARIKEFKELVHSLHKKGIGVIMDVVYNHTYFSDESSFEAAYPGYYYRFYGDGSFANGSGCGSELASEKEMVRKYIIDSVLWWAKEYKIDGFRFDLMALLDSQTLNELSKKLKEINPSAILYGEGWTGGYSPLEYSKAAFKHNARQTPDYAYFNDGFRDAIKGETFNKTALGYVSGNFHLRQSIVSGLLGNAHWAGAPTQTVNYCEAHDNLTLWDKLMVSARGCHDSDRKKMARLSAALVFLAQGIPFIHAGQELLRSKAISENEFVDNSYNSPDIVNSIKWNMLSQNKREVQYFKGLISFRKAHPLLRLKTREAVFSSTKTLPSPDGTICYTVSDESEQILVMINPIPRAKMMVLPEGEWELYISDIRAGNTPMATYCEGVFVPPISAMVLIKKK